MIRNLTVFTSPLGGAGKSTLVSGAACAFALRGETAAVLDLNPVVGDLETILEAEPASPYHLGDAAEERCSLQEAIFPAGGKAPEGVFLGLSPRRREELPKGEMLRQWLFYLSRKYDRVLLDLPWWAPCLEQAMLHAAHTLVICSPERRAVSACERLRQSLFGQLPNEPRLLLNRFHRKQFWETGAFEDLDQVIDRCGLRLIGVVPEDPELQRSVPGAMAQTKDYRQQPFRQKGLAGAVALHCAAARLAGETVPLRELDRL